MSKQEKTLMILVWLTDFKTAQSIFHGNESLSMDQIVRDYRKLPESFKDESINIALIKTHATDCFHRIAEMVNRKQKVGGKKKDLSWKCVCCSNKIVSRSIGCDRCLQWAHFSCIGNPKPIGDWYCPKCVIQVNEG